MKLYVDCNAGRNGNGSKEMPFKTIREAAKAAVAGDKVLVAPGVYREYVDPVNAGTWDARITYTSTTPLGAIITGAEPVKTWAPYEGHVWVCRVKNSMFGSYNPYTTYVMGDWYFAPVTKHTGAVYLNDRALYEADTLEDCEISNSKCVGISLGKYCDPDNNHYFTYKKVKSPTQMERDAVCKGQYHVSLLLMACKPLSIKLENQAPQLPFHTALFRLT